MKKATRRSLTIFGKVYSDPAQARRVQMLQQRLWEEEAAGGAELEGPGRDGETHSTPGGATRPFLPRPLGVCKGLGLALNEAVEPACAGEQVIPGNRVLRPQTECGPGGEVTSLAIPAKELSLAARVLARLHTSSGRPDESMLRTGAKEAKAACKRAALIASRNPSQAAEVTRLAQLLAIRLEVLEPDDYRPAHGSFKASQLMFMSHRVYVVDFDGFCLSDPALDVGYFLAYLRPRGLWYQRPGTMPWFKAAAEAFTTAYREAIHELGLSQTVINGILQRSKLYEAAVLFKIATSRFNRLNSPRPKELSAILAEIAACLST